MPSILSANTLSSGGYDVANSVRMNAADSAKMTIDFSGAGNQKKFTISCWVKRAKITPDASQTILSNYADVNNFCNFTLSTGDKLSFVNRDGGTFNTNIATTRLFRDPSSFYHVVLSVDTTQSTDTNRIKMYVNGVQETLFSTSTYPDQNTDLKFNTTATTNFGSWSGSAQYADGYYSELCFINDAQLAADSFGEFDEDSGIWKPIDVSGLTFGTNGFYLDFEDSGNLGNDVNGGTDLTEVNLAATDQSTDTCTNNFCTWNPLANYTNSVAFSEGNLIAMSGTNDQWDSGRASMGFAKGKWYFECLFVAGVSTQYIGVTDESARFDTANAHDEDGVTVFYNNSGGEIRKDGTATTADYGTFSSSEVAGIAIDADNFTISVYKGGSLIVDAYALSTTRTGFLFPMTTLLNNGDGVKVNFGSPPYSESGGNSDSNGYGNFNQSVPSGYFAINTKNLAEHG